MQPTQYAQGATIFAQGDPSAAVYVIEHGEVAISVGQGRDAVEVARLHAGDLFGESGVLEGRTRAATATALTPCTVLTTDAETFLHAFGLTNDRALVLLKLLCRRLRHTNRLAAGADMAPGLDTADALPRLRLMPLLHPAPGHQHGHIACMLPRHRIRHHCRPAQHRRTSRPGRPGGNLLERRLTP